MINVALHNLGCKVNAYEFDVMRQMLQEKGYNIVAFDETADIYIVNTCTVTNIADRKSRQMLHRAKKSNPNALVIAVGCYVQTGAERIEQDDCIDLAIGNNRKKELIPIMEEFLETRKRREDSIIDINHTNQYEAMHLTRPAEHTRAYIKIQDGCNQFCSYCIIPYARGRIRSRAQQDIIEEVSGLAVLGCQEIVLTGIHISSYGMDFEETDSGKNGDALSPAYAGSRFLELLQELHRIEGIARIRLGSLEPRIITEAFVKELGRLEKVCPHFHLSLQSGCDETLKRMNRHYTSREYYEKVQLLRKYFHNPAITTDVIVGFPGETEAEFASCEQFLERIKLYEMHIFKYSKRQGTPAARMPEQVSDEEKAQRSGRLLALEQRLSKEYRESFPGREVSVLFEERKRIDGVSYMVGHTKEYVKAALRTEENLSNLLLPCIAVRLLTDDVLLVIEKEKH